MTIAGLLDHVKAHDCRVRPVKQAWGQMYRGSLYLLDKTVERQASIVGDLQDELEPEIVARVCRQLGIPEP